MLKVTNRVANIKRNLNDWIGHFRFPTYSFLKVDYDLFVQSVQAGIRHRQWGVAQVGRTSSEVGVKW